MGGDCVTESGASSNARLSLLMTEHPNHPSWAAVRDQLLKITLKVATEDRLMVDFFYFGVPRLQ